METTHANRYPGSCYRCGVKVPAGTGAWSRETGALHADESQCKKTTKTWAAYQRTEVFSAFRAAVANAYATAGLSVLHSTCVEHPTVITGHGLRVTVGGYRKDEVFARGIEIYRDGELVHSAPRVRVETGDYFADQLAQVEQEIALILTHAKDSGS